MYGPFEFKAQFCNISLLKRSAYEDVPIKRRIKESVMINILKEEGLG